MKTGSALNLALPWAHPQSRSAVDSWLEWNFVLFFLNIFLLYFFVVFSFIFSFLPFILQV